MQVLKVDFSASNAADIFFQSLRETGFGVITHHPIAKELLDDVYAGWQTFFADTKKMDFLFDKENQDGYFPYESENAKDSTLSDLKEFFHFYPWGQCPAHLRSITATLYQALSDVAVTLLNMIEAKLPDEISQALSMPLSDMITDSPNTLLRILHYPPLRGDEPEGAVRAAAHGDINLLTILPTATEGGLQVQDIKGAWHDVPCDPGALAINAGDMLAMCSQHYLPSTIHRVINPLGDAAKRSRLSLLLFLHRCDEVRLSTTHTAVDYRLERLREIGLL